MSYCFKVKPKSTNVIHYFEQRLTYKSQCIILMICPYFQVVYYIHLRNVGKYYTEHNMTDSANRTYDLKNLIRHFMLFALTRNLHYGKLSIKETLKLFDLCYLGHILAMIFMFVRENIDLHVLALEML